MADLADRSAVELVADVRARKLGVRDVVAACLARIEETNGVLNAVCTLNPAARADAEAADRRLASGSPPRLLEGVPFLVKDVIPTRGLRTTYGSKLHEHLVPDEDAISVERLRAAGAILLGKTNTPEFATDVFTTNAIFGPTRNPWDARTTSGGSSGGSGAAVAAGMAPLALGTDFGGSVRLPAAFCGIVGLRPAPGRIPLYPADFAWDTLVAHVQGPMARTVEDTALMLAALTGPDDRDPSSLPAEGRGFCGGGPRARDARRPALCLVRRPGRARAGRSRRAARDGAGGARIRGTRGQRGGGRVRRVGPERDHGRNPRLCHGRALRRAGRGPRRAHGGGARRPGDRRPRLRRDRGGARGADALRVLPAPARAARALRPRAHAHRGRARVPDRPAPADRDRRAPGGAVLRCVPLHLCLQRDGVARPSRCRADSPGAGCPSVSRSSAGGCARTRCSRRRRRWRPRRRNSTAGRRSTGCRPRASSRKDSAPPASA